MAADRGTWWRLSGGNVPAQEGAAAAPAWITRLLALRSRGRGLGLLAAYGFCALLILLSALTGQTLALSFLTLLPLLLVVIVSRSWWTGYLFAAGLTAGVQLCYRSLAGGPHLHGLGSLVWYAGTRMSTYCVLVLVMQSLLRAAEALRCYARTLAAERADAWRLATTDPLTGLANRRRFDAHLEAEISRCSSQGQPLAVLLLDIDRFKEINDRAGHAAGDAALGEVAAALRAATQAQGLPARIGGDEFAIVLPELDQEQAAQVAEAVHAQLLAHDAEDALTVSIGVASLGPPAETPLPADPAAAAAILLASADRALYQTKRRSSRRQGHAALTVVVA